jgi:hypothetical protein
MLTGMDSIHQTPRIESQPPNLYLNWQSKYGCIKRAATRRSRILCERLDRSPQALAYMTRQLLATGMNQWLYKQREGYCH